MATVSFDPILVAQLILQYGIPGALQIIETLSKPSVTLEDIQGLRLLVKKPEEYL